MSDDLESISGVIPGERTRELTTTLRAYESHNVTYLADDFPVFWESASGSTVTDVDGNRYLDLTSAFGVANVGHCNPHVVAAVAQQATQLMHGMGDVHPSDVRTRLLNRIVAVVPGESNKVFFATTGSEAVEAALKTAMLATGRSRFVSYRGAYHGLSVGALAISGIPKFREPFGPMLGQEPLLLDYPDANADVSRAIARARKLLTSRDDVAALIVEPIQGRGGCVVPPAGYLAALQTLCGEHGVLTIVDEIYTGFARTGRWFAVEHEGIEPDILCIGKAMGGGFPISATIARAQIMDVWPVSSGEALHTSTYLGNPMGCAAALATIDEIERLQLPQRATQLGAELGLRLRRLHAEGLATAVRGRGLLWGLQLRDAATASRVVARALAKGVLLLQSGPAGDVLTIAPPLVITERQLDRALDLLEAALRSAA